MLEFIDYSNFKLLTYEVPADVLHFKVYVIDNDCIQMQAFISDKDSSKVQIEKEFGNTIRLNLENVKHDLNSDEIQKGFENLGDSSENDMSLRLIDFRITNDILKEPVFVNFFCGYWKQISNTVKFDGSIELAWEVEEFEKPDIEDKNFEDSYKEWLKLDAQMFLYELRMMASKFDEISTITETFEEDSSPLSKDVGFKNV